MDSLAHCISKESHKCRQGKVTALYRQITSCLEAYCLWCHYQSSKRQRLHPIIHCVGEEFYRCCQGNIVLSNIYESRLFKELLAYGANIDLPNSDGWTPLHIASQKNHIDVVKVTPFCICMSKILSRNSLRIVPLLIIVT